MSFFLRFGNTLILEGNFIPGYGIRRYLATQKPNEAIIYRPCKTFARIGFYFDSFSAVVDAPKTRNDVPIHCTYCSRRIRNETGKVSFKNKIYNGSKTSSKNVQFNCGRRNACYIEMFNVYITILKLHNLIKKKLTPHINNKN